MPYPTAASAPAAVRRLPAAAARIWRSAFNDCHARGGADEERCFKIAWGAIKNAGYAKDERTGKWRKT
jgi:cation transport regulator ChaB